MTAAIQDAVREAGELQAPLRIIAGESWLDAGRPVKANRVLSVGDLRGIVVAGHGSLCCHVPRSPVHSAFPICDSADESAANWW